MNVLDDRSHEKSIERANSYRQMMGLWAWKDFMKWLTEEKNSRVNDLLISNGSESLERTKGFAEAVSYIETELGYILEGRT